MTGVEIVPRDEVEVVDSSATSGTRALMRVPVTRAPVRSRIPVYVALVGLGVIVDIVAFVYFVPALVTFLGVLWRT